jgi:leucine dehydrogenase
MLRHHSTLSLTSGSVTAEENPVFEMMAEHGYGEVHLRRDAPSGLNAIVAIHDTRLGPALGGCRFIEYTHEEFALRDALRLARGMTYKAALCGVPHGGGKSVIIRPKGAFDRSALFRAFGRFIEDLGGRYITAEDSGTGLSDMEVIRSTSRHVTGVDPRHGGSGDPSPFTALGVRRGIEACVRFAMGKDSLKGVHVAVQGIGHVGYHLCRELHAEGATLSVADVDPLKAERAQREFGATVLPLDQIFAAECDVFAPCALGSALNDGTIPQLRCRIVAGAANNQLAEARHADDLRQRGIAYAPDYAINAGGLINVAQEIVGYDAAHVRERTVRIYDTILEILQRAERGDCTTTRIADAMVEEKLDKSGRSTKPVVRAVNDG